MHLEANDRDEALASQAADTEITLGTGKMLFLFFGLVVLCSVFFALGFKLGKGSASTVELSSSPNTSPSSNTAKPGAKPATNPSDLTFYKSVGQDTPSAQMTPPQTASSPAAGEAQAAPSSSDQATQTAPSGNYLVQVAAVTKQEDADVLVDALKKKQYAAFSTMLGDKLYHVQVGPFTDIKDAEATRAKLVGDGYNPILKK